MSRKAVDITLTVREREQLERWSRRHQTARSLRRKHGQFERYRDVSFAGTIAEYMHGLWHDVQIRVGPEHLPLPHMRRRMNLLAEMFPPNPGYRVFAEELEKKE